MPPLFIAPTPYEILCQDHPPPNSFFYVKLTELPLDARRYFKQSEIVLYRQQPEEALALGQQTKIAGAHSAPSPTLKQLPAQ